MVLKEDEILNGSDFEKYWIGRCAVLYKDDKAGLAEVLSYRRMRL